MPNYSTIQKLYYRQSFDFTMAGFADALRPDKFTGVHSKRWQVKIRLWLVVLHAWEARLGIPTGDHSSEERRKFTDANKLFVECVISVLADGLVDVYIHIIDAKEEVKERKKRGERSVCVCV
jgi:hypothetical protein